MNKRLKYSLLLICTLFIGMIIGFLVSGRITKTRVDEMKSYYTNIGFNRQFMSIIKPTPEQREVIKPILEKYADYNRDLMIENREGQKELFFNLKNELETHLTEEQINRLNNIWERRKHHYQKNKTDQQRRERNKPPSN